MKSKLICIALAAAFALTACGGPKLTAVNMPQTTLEVATGETATAETSYTYDGETPENAQPEVVYTSSDESIATVDEGWVDMIGSGNVTITAATQYGVSATVDLTGEAAATSAASTTGDSNSNSAEGASDSNISLSSGALPFSMAAGTQEWFGVDFGDYICNAVVDNINQYRAAVGVAPLTCTADMSAIADSRCLAMVVNGVMSHDGNQTAEIIAQNYNSAASVVAGWANSPGHYAAMTNPNYTVCGVGCAFEESGWSYWCVTLG